MKAIIFIVLLVCLQLQAKDLILGTRINNLLISTQKVAFGGIPLIRRDKDYVYTDSKQRIIKKVEADGILLTKVEKDYVYIDPKDSIIEGVVAYDLWHTEAEVNVTAGGVGESHVTLHLQSEIGIGLNYAILVFIE